MNDVCKERGLFGNMIPKMIHYCWFGRKPKPDIVRKCLTSWYDNCKEYEIVEWNEDNYDVNKHPYIQQVYKEMGICFRLC